MSWYYTTIGINIRYFVWNLALFCYRRLLEKLSVDNEIVVFIDDSTVFVNQAYLGNLAFSFEFTLFQFL